MRRRDKASQSLEPLRKIGHFGSTRCIATMVPASGRPLPLRRLAPYTRVCVTSGEVLSLVPGSIHIRRSDPVDIVRWAIGAAFFVMSFPMG